MPLTLAQKGEENIITRIGGRRETRRFLEGLGFVIGEKVRVVAENSGNVIVRVKDSRIAIGCDMANKIFV